MNGTPGRGAYEPGATAYNLWVDVMITNGVICDPFDTLGNVEQMAWREIGARLQPVAAQEPHAAEGPCPGCESLRRQHAETCGEVGMLAGILTEIRDGDHPYGSYARDRARTALDRLHGAAPEPQPAPALAALREAAAREIVTAAERDDLAAQCDKLRQLLDDFTHAVIDLDTSARIVKAAHAVREKAGLPVIDQFSHLAGQ